MPPVLVEIDRIIREGFFDPKLKGVDWSGAVARAAAELSRSAVAGRAECVYDRLLATLSDSHTFRMPAGRLPERGWGTAGLRIGQDGDGYAVKGVLPGSSAERAGMKIGDRILEVDGRKYGSERVNFRDLFFVFEGAPGSSSQVDLAARRRRRPASSVSRARPRNPATRSSGRARASSARTGRPTATRTSGA